MFWTRSLCLAGAAALAAALVLAGCGSGGRSDTQTTSATATWADGVCSAIVSYTNALKAATGGLKAGNISQEGLDEATGKVKVATQTLVTTVKGLGKPGTEAGASAKTTLSGLASSLQADAAAIRAALVGKSALGAVSAVSTTLLTTQDQISSAFDELRQADAKGELKDAFAQAPSCASVPGA